MSTTKSIRMPLTFSENAFGYSDFADFTGGNNVFKEVVHYYPIGGDGILHGHIVLPETYDNTVAPKMRLLAGFLAARGGTDAIRMEFSYVSTGDGDALDPSAAVETLAATFSVASLAAKTAKMLEFSPTATNLVAGEFIRYRLKRVKSHGDDNVNDTLYVLGPYLRANFT